MKTLQSNFQRSLLILFFLLGENALAQNMIQEVPTKLKTLTLTTPNVEEAIIEDATNDLFKSIPYRFGLKIPVNYSPSNCGEWFQVESRYYWQMRFHAENAKSLHFNFKSFHLNADEKIWVYNDDKTVLYGPYTSQNNYQDSLFSSFIIPGENINIQLSSNSIIQTPFIIESITYGYRSVGEFILKNFGASGACETNINCPLGDNWQKEKRSVALILVNGNGWCTGSLINNTLQDTSPYLLTANHCSSSSYSNWQFAFNWEAPGCGPQLSPMNQVMAGATYIASSALSDFLLIKLNAKVPDSFHPFFNGWDIQNIAPDSVVCIHHPSGDIKKISTAENACQDSSYFNAFCWKIGQWTNGVTEGGSSGSPLFNKAHRLVGTLTGGPSYCCSAIADRHDYFGKLAVAWNADTAIHHQLAAWLNPNGLQINNWNSFDPTPTTTFIGDNVTLSNLNQLQATVFSCKDSNSINIRFKNNGSTTLNNITFVTQINQQNPQFNTWQGTLAPGVSADYKIYNIKSYQIGPNDVKIWSQQPNNNSDVHSQDDTIKITVNYIYGSSLRLSIQTDDKGSETIWKIKNSSGTLFYSGGPYKDILGGQLINEDFCLVPGCYQLTVEDLAGNGMCCNAGNGSFVLYNNDNKKLVSGSQFTCNIQGNFCVNANGIIPITKNTGNNTIKFYPNPANEYIQVAPDIKIIYLQNSIGQNFYLDLKEYKTADLSQIPSGHYMVVGDNMIIGELIIAH